MRGDEDEKQSVWVKVHRLASASPESSLNRALLAAVGLNCNTFSKECNTEVTLGYSMAEFRIAI